MGDREFGQKTQFFDTLTSASHALSFLMAIFELFKKNAADWWQKWSEIRIFDIGKFALKFQMLTLCAKITRKRKVSESLTTCSSDPVRAQRMRKSDGTRTGEGQERARWELVCPESLRLYGPRARKHG